MAEPQIRLGDLAFSDRAGIARVALPVSSNFTFVVGASNTGKSFAVKALDFMLGGNRELPDIQERRRYDRLQLALSLSTGERLLIERALASGDFAVSLDGAPPATWSTRHNKENEENLSNYLLNRLGMAGKEIAQDKSGTKKALSFRDIVRLCIVDETSIQSETSPAETGDRTLVPVERNVFKYMLTGDDDAALITQLKPREFSVGRNAQVTLLENMLVEVEAELADSFPDVDELGDELAKMQDELADLERQIAYARESARTKLDAKARLSGDVGRDQQRVSDIAIALENFDQLKRVYDSDVERLASIEESGFLLGLTGDDSCPVCGAPAEAQVHRHALSEIEAARAAAEIEIAKIRMHGVELLATIEDTAAELDRTGARLKANQQALAAVEAEISAGLPKTDDKLRRLSEIIPRRDRINRGIGLSKRKVELEKQIGTLKKQRQKRQPSNFHVGLSTQTANEFAREVGSILEAWGFPGACQTFFDTEGTFDLVIDGKRRRDNGKGVRAITHAAFKIGLMTFCRARGLPHPGFVVLDSPLITYRDPIRSKEGTLSADEQAIKNSDLAERMLEYLGTLGSLGQVIIFDNIDPPANAATYADIIIFTNNPTEGRQGLL